MIFDFSNWGDKVGADPSLTGASTWLRWQERLEEVGLKLIPIYENPIDKIWLDKRPLRSLAPLEVISNEFSGKVFHVPVYFFIIIETSSFQ